MPTAYLHILSYRQNRSRVHDQTFFRASLFTPGIPVLGNMLFEPHSPEWMLRDNDLAHLMGTILLQNGQLLSVVFADTHRHM